MSVCKVQKGLFFVFWLILKFESEVAEPRKEKTLEKILGM